MGLLYEKGQDVPKDLKKSIDLYTKAIELGASYSMFNMEGLFENGIETEKNMDAAINLLQIAISL